MTETTVMTCVLFADICDSTGYFSRHGDAEGRRIVLLCLEQVAAAVAEVGGRVVDRVGDELLCTNPDLKAALSSGFAIQDRVRSAVRAGRLPQDMKLHMGMHFGPVLQDRQRIFGDTIHIAKRLVDLAKCDQILTSQETLSGAGPLAPQSRPVDRIRIKGQSEPLSIVELLRESTEMTQVASLVLTKAEVYSRCLLRAGSRLYVVDEAHPVLSIGRLPSCTLQIARTCVSREHALIELQKGRVIFSDQSTNGSYVTELPSQEAVLVRREQRWLRNQGTLRLGSQQLDDHELVLHYACERA